MKDPRMIKLAYNLVNYSVDLKPGEKIQIDLHGPNTSSNEFVAEIVNQVYKVGGIPFVTMKDIYVERAIMLGATKQQMKDLFRYEAYTMNEMDAYIGVRAFANTSQTSDVPAEKSALYNDNYWAPLTIDIRCAKTKWVGMRYPTPSMAQAASMSTEGFEEYFFKVCNLDYARMSKAMDPMVALMEKTDKVRLISKGTDLSFSIKGINVVKCDGKANIPDGEVYSAPVRDSVNGVIAFNTPSVYKGYTYDNIRLEFKDGKIVKAEANDTDRINKVFDTDEGARYVGEFAIGVNPYITFPMKETLFDEKICGSIHFTPGNCVPGCNNNNVSKIHWDLVLIQTPEFGGGEIWFDDQLIRKDGMFVLPEIQGLNPENLK